MDAHLVSRRGFLAAAAGAPGNRTLAAKPHWLLSTSSVQFRTLPVEQACEAIAKAGYAAVDFWPSSFKCPHLDEIEKRLGPAGFDALLRKLRLSIAAFTSYGTPTARYGPVLGRAGGGVVVRESKYGNVRELEQEMAAFLKGLEPELRSAEQHGYRIAIENHHKALLQTLESFQTFVSMAKHPLLGIALAPYHLQSAGISVEQVIRICGQKLLFFYAWQHGEGMNQLPGAGPTDFTPWLAALNEIGYAGCVNVFMHGDEPPGRMAEALAASGRFLEKCGKSLNR